MKKMTAGIATGVYAPNRMHPGKVCSLGNTRLGSVVLNTRKNQGEVAKSWGQRSIVISTPTITAGIGD
jgi:hypothetical protein